VASSAQTDVLLIIDELGKNLEFAAQNQGADDLYLLQQLAERSENGPQVYILCLLHQSFAEYSQRLASKESAMNGPRFRGGLRISPFTESADAMTRLVRQLTHLVQKHFSLLFTNEQRNGSSA